MASQNIPVKIEFGGVDNVSPILGNITLRLSGVNKKIEKTNELAKKISFASTLTALTLVSQRLSQFSSSFNGYLTSSIDNYSNVTDNLNRVSILLEKKPSDTFLSGLKNQWRELAEVSTMSASEISDVSKDIVNSGVRDTDTISKFINLAVLLADASKRELGATEAFSLLNEFKNSFDLKNADLAKLTDQIVLARDNGTAQYQDIKEGFKYAAPTWGALTNATPADYLAFIAQLSNHGITGSTAGTALRRLPLQFVENLDKSTLMRLENGADDDLKNTLQDFKSNKQNAVLKILGLNYEDISDKETHKIDLFKALKQINTALPKLSQKDQTSVLSQLFGKEALSTGLTAIRFMDEIVKTVDLVKNHSEGKAQEFADSTRNTLSSKIKETQHAWENFKISILDSGTGETLSNLTDKFKGLAGSVEGLSDTSKSMIGILGVGTYGFVEICAKLMPVLVTLKLLKDGLSSIITLTTVWNFVTALNPLVWIIGAAILALGALGYAIYDISHNYKEFGKNIEETNRRILPKFITDKIYGNQEQEDEKQLNAFYTPEQKNKLKEGLYRNNFLDGSVTPNKDNLADILKNSQRKNKERELSQIFENYNQNRLESSAKIDINVNGLPAGSNVIQKTKNMQTPNVKLGLIGGSLQ
ncbi:MAG: phage tail tape measure protein [Bdellovibrionota bacterium]